jgi:hypothetical protein
MQEHFPGSLPASGIEDAALAPPQPIINQPVLIKARPWITLTTLDLALRQFDEHKCPGPDGFRPIVLCHLPEKARLAIIHIYNAIIELKYSPLLWRGAGVVFIPKPGKEDYTKRRAFRPIALMQFLFKALERLVKWHIEQHSKTFHPDQHAFRKSHCTENALSHMADAIESSILKGKIALAVFLDIQGAFDNLTSTAIVQAWQPMELIKTSSNGKQAT